VLFRFVGSALRQALEQAYASYVDSGAESLRVFLNSSLLGKI
jgi:hypothetical protein